VLGVYTILAVGVAVAAPSGAGVALSVTSGGVNALIGVAISASLLPPACNTGAFLFTVSLLFLFLCLSVQTCLA